eukprot:SAG11_NODE_1912_length_4078_cov_2.769289_4_plen_118_part_00
MVRDYLSKAKASDKIVTVLLQKSAKACGGRLYGLDYRIKSKSSLTRKVLEKSKGDVEKLADVLLAQNDALRYTILFETEEYVRGVSAVEGALEAQSINRVKMKNFWRKPVRATILSI